MQIFEAKIARNAGVECVCFFGLKVREKGKSKLTGFNQNMHQRMIFSVSTSGETESKPVWFLVRLYWNFDVSNIFGDENGCNCNHNFGWLYDFQTKKSSSQICFKLLKSKFNWVTARIANGCLFSLLSIQSSISKVN